MKEALASLLRSLTRDEIACFVLWCHDQNVSVTAAQHVRYLRSLKNA